MRCWTGLAVLAFVGLLASGRTARAETVVYNTDFEPNIVNLWSSVPFTGPAFNINTPNWGTIFSPSNPGFTQIVTANFGSLNPTSPTPNWLTFSITYAGNVTNNPAFAMDFQEVYYDFNTGTVVQGFAGRLVSNGTNIVGGTYAATPGLGPTTASGAPLFIGPTPEPSSMIAFGAGLGVLALVRRRRRARSH